MEATAVTAAARPPRGHATCSCCEGNGSHKDGSECTSCQGLGHRPQTETEHCPGRPPLRRRHWRQPHASDTSYRGHHEAPGGEDDDVAAPMHDVEGVMPGVYDRPELYRHCGPHSAESHRQLQHARGNPDADVRIYRSQPHGHHEINRGDWVTTSSAYARQHSQSNTEGGGEQPVVHATVKARHLFSEGDVNEWGYHGPDIEHAEPHHPGSPHTAAWTPDRGIFGPTTGMDPRLFDEHGELRPEVRGAIMEKLDQALRVDGGATGSDWQDWTRVYLAGGSASEWAGERPNETAQDLDILIGVDYKDARGTSFPGMDPEEITTSLNATLRAQFNEPGWEAPFGGYWDVTGYVNPRAWSIEVLKPYAAYDLTDMRWAVKPPHLPDHNAGNFDKGVLSEARAIASWARAILRIGDKKVRHREAHALWEFIHRSRDRAFSDEGDGWQDPGNVIEKFLAYSAGHLLDKIKELAYSEPPAMSYSKSDIAGEADLHQVRHGEAAQRVQQLGRQARREATSQQGMQEVQEQGGGRPGAGQETGRHAASLLDVPGDQAGQRVPQQLLRSVREGMAQETCWLARGAAVSAAPAGQAGYRAFPGSDQGDAERLLGLDAQHEQGWLRPVQHVAHEHSDSSRLGVEDVQGSNPAQDDGGAHLPHHGSVVSGRSELLASSLRELDLGGTSHPAFAWGEHEDRSFAKAASIAVMIAAGPDGNLTPERFAPLESRLLGKGGRRVVNPGFEPDLDKIMDRGQDWDGSTATTKKMRARDCHANSARLHETQGHHIATGYALSDDGLWRQHSWGIHSRTGKPIETTTPRARYHGAVLTAEEADDFARKNLPHRQAILHTAAGSDGDRTVTCSKGHEHWGAHGAAGLLLRHRDGDGPVRYLLQKRSAGVDHPGQWSIPSGAKGKDETPEQGAEREFREEMGRLPLGSKHSHTVKSTDCGDWAFHTAVYDAPSTALPKGTAETGHEVAGSGWFTPHEIKGLPLHPAFAKSWDTVRRSKGPVTAASDVEFSHREWKPGKHSFEAHQDGKNVGYAVGIDKGDHGYVDELYLHPDARGKGLARKLMQHAVDHFAPRPVRLMPDAYQKDDEEPGLDDGSLRGFYTSMGFEQDPDQKRHMIRHAAAAAQFPMTLYRGEGSHDAPSYYPKTGPDARAGAWWTSNLDKARQYASSAKGSVYQVDVHQHEAEPSGGPENYLIKDPAVQGRRTLLDQDAGHTAAASEGPFYHGSPAELRDGDLIEPGKHPPSHNPFGEEQKPREHVYLSQRRQYVTEHYGPHVYEVEPTGPITRDPEYNSRRMMRSKHPLRVVRHVSKNWGEPVIEQGKIAGKNGQMPELEFHHTVSRGYDQHSIDAYRPGDGPSFYGAKPGGDRVGHLGWWPDTGDIADLHVDEDHQRRGVASEMYRRAKEITPHLQHSDVLSPDARKWIPTVAAAMETGGVGDWLDTPNPVGDDEDHSKEVTASLGGSEDLIPSQRAAFQLRDEDRASRHARWDAHLQVATDRAPGTMVWRGERRNEGEDPAKGSVGMHWSTNHDSLINTPNAGQRNYIYQGRISHPDQAYDRSHPIWHGRHQSYPHEAEVRFKPGQQVHVEGYYSSDSQYPGMFHPFDHEKSAANGWNWHPTGHAMPVKYTGQGAADYSHLGIHPEAASDTTVCIVLDVPQELIHNVDESVDYPTHVTVIYCGKRLDEDSFEEVLRRAEDAARRQPGPLTGTLSGLDTFDPSNNSDGKVPAFIPANIPGIRVLHSRLEDLSASDHKGYIPHVTLGYFDHGDKLPSPHHAVPITFTHLTVRRGEHEAHRFPLGG